MNNPKKINKKNRGNKITYLVGELEGLDQTDGLVDVAANGEIVDGDLANNLVGVDDEETAVSDTYSSTIIFFWEGRVK